MSFFFVEGSTLTKFGIKGTNHCGSNYTGGEFYGNNTDVTPTGRLDGTCQGHDKACGLPKIHKIRRVIYCWPT
jgi:hypothetical protein